MNGGQDWHPQTSSDAFQTWPLSSL
jgi:hypothetical protein